MNLSTLKLMIDEATAQLIRAEQMVEEGNIKDGERIIAEWEDYSSLDLFTIPAGEFAKM